MQNNFPKNLEVILKVQRSPAGKACSMFSSSHEIFDEWATMDRVRGQISLRDSLKRAATLQPKQVFADSPTGGDASTSETSFRALLVLVLRTGFLLRLADN